jgi:hypothetical protein
MSMGMCVRVRVCVRGRKRHAEKAAVVLEGRHRSSWPSLFWGLLRGLRGLLRGLMQWLLRGLLQRLLGWWLERWSGRRRWMVSGRGWCVMRKCMPRLGRLLSGMGVDMRKLGWTGLWYVVMHWLLLLLLQLWKCLWGLLPLLLLLLRSWR